MINKFKNEILNNKLEIKLNSIINISESINLYNFYTEKRNFYNKLNYKFLELNPLETVKISLYDSINNCMNNKFEYYKNDRQFKLPIQRYYSLLNTPYPIHFNNYYNLQNNKSVSNYDIDFVNLISELPDILSFKCIIKDNTSDNINKFEHSFPYRLRKLKEFNEDYILSIDYPFGNASYLGNCNFKLNDNIFQTNNIVLISNGTGIVPMFQLIKYISQEISSRFYYDEYINCSTIRVTLIYTDEENDKKLIYLQKELNYHLNIINNINANSIDINRNFIIVNDNYHDNISNTLYTLKLIMDKKHNELKKCYTSNNSTCSSNNNKYINSPLFIICGNKILKESAYDILIKDYGISKEYINTLF